jgi:uncharacterized protein HemX
MSRLTTLLIAAVIAIGLGGVQFAKSQTEQAPPAETTPAPKAKKGLTEEDKAKAKEERARLKEERAKAKAEKAKAREEKKAAREAKKAKRQECVAQGQKDNLKGKKLREFVKTCTAG